ncbi:MAG: SLC13/DASS family transporter [Lewinellaceae bacterium]|nr:SLC13/DASS family transporter [Lewinellaceae bacterium]
MNRHRLALWAGPAVFAILLLLPAAGGISPEAKAAAAITLWMTIWWITEAVPVSVTALLPLVFFPLTGVASLKTISVEFGNEIIFLFMGGMLFGQAIERWNLHLRVAYQVVLKIGRSPSRMILGFMAATGFISMWISNTATAVMMTPVAIAVGQGAATSESEAHNQNFRVALLLGVAYACSIGGLATIIGTPTNAIFVGFVEQNMGRSVSFWQWFLVGFPFASILLLLCWWLLIRLFPLHAGKLLPEQRAVLQQELHRLGPMQAAEKRLIVLFGAVVLCWITGSLWLYRIFPNCNDTVVVMLGAILLFVFPADKKSNSPLLDWNQAIKIPWGVLLLFGGGLALAKGFDSSGLAKWIGLQMEGLSNLPELVLLLIILSVVVMLSEIASNIATASMMMPVLAAMASTIGIHPFGLLLSAAMASSIGFGLPVATAPNAIVFSSGHLHTHHMAKAGFLLDLVSILLLIVFIYTVLPWVWGFQL